MLLHNDFQLTEEQALIVSQPAEAKILVTAGPGTGKTHLLIARIEELAETYNLNPGSDILVLSFSRAAVHEIKKRKEQGKEYARYIRPFTFDSFATRLLAEFDEAGNWRSESYDGRINYASRLIKNNSEVTSFIGEYKHIIIDEIQDLVAERSVFVKTLLDAAEGGFTLLGDPAQGIYDFQLAENPVKGSGELYDWLRRRFRPDLLQYTLTKNFRAKTELSRISLWAGAELNSPNPDYSRIKTRLESDIASLQTLGNMKLSFLRKFKGQGITAILCRTNGQALLISRELNAAGIEHTLRRRAGDRLVPGWVGRILENFQQSQINRTAFIQMAGPFEKEVNLTGSEMWNLLKEIEGDYNAAKTLKIGDMAQKIKLGLIPEELNDLETSDLIISTVHRAKGLEFDRVIVLEPNYELKGKAETNEADEARIQYVALTRPKSELWHMEKPGIKGVFFQVKNDRWIGKYDKIRVCCMEVEGTDIHAGDPAGNFRHPTCNLSETQTYIGNNIQEGDAVELRLFEITQNPLPTAFYTVYHNGRPVGTTSEKFSETLSKVLKAYSGWTIKWPNSIEQLYVETVDTVAGLADSGIRAGLGPNGIWLRVRVSGMGQLKFP